MIEYEGISLKVPCKKCKGFGGTLVLKNVESFGFSKTPRLVKLDCPDCWGRGYMEPVTSDVPGNKQAEKYFMYP